MSQIDSKYLVLIYLIFTKVLDSMWVGVGVILIFTHKEIES